MKMIINRSPGKEADRIDGKHIVRRTEQEQQETIVAIRYSFQ